MNTKVKKVHETKTGLNDLVSINNRTYTNNQAYKKAKQGLVPGFCGVNNHGTKFIRSNPDKTTKNNIE